MPQMHTSISIHADITIIGGGLAGVCAAIAAARQGSSVSLIQNRPVLGGNSSSEIRVWTRGASGGGNLFGEEMGIVGELKLANQYKNPEGNPILWDEILLDAVFAEPRIALFLNTLVVDVGHCDGHIHSLSALEINSERRFLFTSAVYVDATGDGFVAASAGLAYAVGKESKDTYHEQNAPEQYDPTTQGCTILMTFARRDHAIPFVAPSYAYSLDYIEQLLNTGGRMVTDSSNGCDFWWIEFGGQQDTINGIASIGFELKRLTLGIYNYIKNSGKFDADTLELSWTGSLPGKRESRRFATEHVLTQGDILETRQFDDVAFYGGWYLDFHPSQGIYSKANSCTQIPVGLYGIPLRCLYSQGSDNLLLCGRIIGTSHAAFASTRIMNTCALSGQAAGTAASVIAGDGGSTEQLARPQVYRKVQSLLEAQDMLLPGYSVQKDTSGMHISCSSVIDSLPGSECGSLVCDRDCFLAIPGTLAALSALVLDAHSDVDLHVTYRYAYVPSRNSKQGTWHDDRVELHAGRCLLELAPYSREGMYLQLVVKAAPGVSIPVVDEELVGVLCGYPEEATCRSPLLVVRSFASYGAQNLMSGRTRPYGDANIWLSGNELEPSVEITFDCEQTISALSFFFDCNLNEEMPSSRVPEVDSHHNIYLRRGVSPSLVRDFDVHAVVDGERVLLYQVRDNHQRHVAVAFEQATTTGTLGIRFLRTYGAKHTGVYDIRIH